MSDSRCHKIFEWHWHGICASLTACRGNKDSKQGVFDTWEQLAPNICISIQINILNSYGVFFPPSSYLDKKKYHAFKFTSCAIHIIRPSSFELPGNWLERQRQQQTSMWSNVIDRQDMAQATPELGRSGERKANYSLQGEWLGTGGVYWARAELILVRSK